MKSNIGRQPFRKLAKGLRPSLINLPILPSEVDEHIETSMRLAQFLGFNGTPSFVIGEALLPGFVEQAELQTLVDEVRNNE